MKTKTKAEQRIEIAKDVLRHIKAKTLVAKTKAYLDPQGKGQFCGKSLKEVLPRLKTCRVCIIGGIFYSYVNRHNNFEIDEAGISGIRDWGMMDAISMFSNKQMRLMECAFEASPRFGVYDNSVLKRITASDYRGKHNLETDDKALRHIMNNIIANKGTFKP